MKPIQKILIANRGEIASRIIRTCRRLGIATVAVYSEADRRAPHALQADEAMLIGPASPRESYLHIERIIAAARHTGADAIHPGYGFLSENAALAEACVAAGIVFIGPPAEIIRRMGLKSAARRLMAEAGVPVIPGYDGEDQSGERLRDEILAIGLPVLVKASAGGGGKGMRVVRTEAEIESALAGARREAETAFGDGTLLIEKYLANARHIEVQLLGDHHGHLLQLFERDCSLQRRHQKIVEESPAPAIDRELRENLGVSALRAGRAIGYVNAGTVEFLVSSDGTFYFIEVNTRLQVEHPVTEMITGLDLVEWQIAVAEGRPLPMTQQDLQRKGHAIEARLYAEDPAHDFLPATGRIVTCQWPEAIEGLRVETGIALHQEIGIHYDPLLAKLIAWGEDRNSALGKLVHALRQTYIHGLKTNRDFLLRVLEDPAFVEGRAVTTSVEDHLDRLLAASGRGPEVHSLLAAAMHWLRQARESDPFLEELPLNYRNNPYRDPSMILQMGESRHEVAWRELDEQRYAMRLGDRSHQVELIDHRPGTLRLEIDGLTREFRLTQVGEWLTVDSALGLCSIHKLPRHPLPTGGMEAGAATSSMPGQVVKLLVEPGQRVEAGQPLLLLEAMKMEHTLRAAEAGQIESILVAPGEIVGPGQVLIQMVPDEESDAGQL